MIRAATVTKSFLAAASLVSWAASFAHAQLPPGQIVSSDGLGEPAGYLSPPRVVRPYFVCSDVVAVEGVLPNATVELEVTYDGQQPQTLTQFVPDGFQAQFTLPEKFGSENDFVRARQLLGSETSDWDSMSVSPENHALDHSVVYPNGLPVPALYWSPYLDCGIRVGITNYIAGAEVAVRALTPSGDNPLFGPTVSPFHAHEEDTQVSFRLGEILEGTYEFCGESESTQMLTEHEVVMNPFDLASLPAPEPPVVYEDDRRIVVDGLANGALVTVRDASGAKLASRGTVFRSLGLKANRALVAGEIVTAEQAFVDCNLLSVSDPVAVLECGDLPAPSIARPLPGTRWVRVLESTAGAVLFIFDDSGTLIGRGVAPAVEVSRDFVSAETISVVQQLGSCISDWAFQIEVDCGARSRGELDLLSKLPGRSRRRAGRPLVANACQ